MYKNGDIYFDKLKGCFSKIELVDRDNSYLVMNATMGESLGKNRVKFLEYYKNDGRYSMSIKLAEKRLIKKIDLN